MDHNIYVSPAANAVHSDGVRLRVVDSLNHIRNDPDNPTGQRRYWTIDMDVDTVECALHFRRINKTTRRRQFSNNVVGAI
jgi:hypothetical protein